MLKQFQLSTKEVLMNTPLPAERKILSGYNEVSRTFTYGIYATLPLFLVYQIVTYLIGVVAVKDGQEYLRMNGADQFLEKIIAFLGMPPATTAFLLVTSMMLLFASERKRLGFIHSQASFFLRTLGESAYFGLILGVTAGLLTASAIYFIFGTFPPIISPSVPEPLINILQKTGFGFYEELLYRVMLLGGLLAFFRVLRVPGRVARIIAVTVASMVFSFAHFIGPYGYPYDIGSFLYLSYLGVLLSAIYLWRGFATAAWSHTLFDIFISL